MSPFWQNVLLILGTAVGAGIFSLPLALQYAGIVPFFFFMIALSVLMYYVNKQYREIVEYTAGKHQLPGYAKRILGKQAGYIAIFLLLFSTCGALLAYLILGGAFIGNVFHVSSTAGSMVFFAIVFCLVFFDGKNIGVVDAVLSMVKIILLGALILISVTSLFEGRFTAIPLIGTRPFFAYGSILFALTGFSIIPELKRNRKMKKSLSTAQIIMGILYIFFAFSLYPFISEGGLVFDVQWKRVLFDIAGLSAVLTPYLLLSWVGYDIFNKDLSLSRRSSLLLVLCIPFVFYLLGLQNFNSVLSLTGGVFLGGIALLINKMHQKKFPDRPVMIHIFIQLIFMGGIVYEIYKFMLG